MTQQRRQQLRAQLADVDGSGSRMSALCTLCLDELSVAGAGATVLSKLDGDGDGDGQNPRRGLVHATNEISSGLEELQLTVGEGPCLDAFSTGGPVLITDLVGETARWPAFTRGALELGAAALFSFPLQIGVVRLGSLDLYRDEAMPLTDAQLSDALLLADLATEVIVQELEGHRTEDVSWLADPHVEVHQASGMLQVQMQTSTQDALLRLRAHAYTHETPISEVARQIIARELRFTHLAEPD